jgi:hypothetical protein
MDKASGKGMLSGLTKKAPEPCDSSCVPPKGSVDNDTTRKETASSQRTLGPRTA